MKIIKTKIEGVFLIENFNATDMRGEFVKTFHKKNFEDLNLDMDIRESYFSISHKNVIRGMHFQTPPYDHNKMVYVVKGEILDVVLDLRKNSKTYKEYITVTLSEKNKTSIYIPKGMAHGFVSLIDNTITVYNVTTEYNANSDSGIHMNSFGFQWNVDRPTISLRDNGFASFDNFEQINPF
ncbi:MAG: dTDP-4-dehydrorhamnose 3,5-epimerase family protein [Algibacter sp.]